MPSPRPKPSALKLMEGNPGKRPIPQNEPKPELTMPEAPSRLTGSALAEWFRIVPEIFRLGMMTRLDVAALACWCEAVGDFYDALADLHDQPKTASKRYAGALRRKDAASERIRKWAVEFGFTTSSRSRIIAIPREDGKEKAKNIIGW